MIGFLLWTLLLLAGGVIVSPLVISMLSKLPSRGVGFSKALFLTLFTYFYWLLGNLRLINNSTASLWSVFLVLAVLILALTWRSSWAEQIKNFYRGNWRYILRSELIFIAGFGLFAFLRSYNPSISGTEKPMELAFINAIMASPAMPPNDPWLSGYAISYYYMGYLTSAMLAMMTGIAGSLAFNLTLAMTFGLVCQTSYELLFNLLEIRRGITSEGKIASRKHNGLLALLAPFFILIVSNAEGFLESLHAKGLFWTKLNGQWVSPFWTWLKILELDSPPSEPLSWLPHRAGGIWWWRASRVLADYNQQGGRIEVIDEFPFFSYLLGDLHPHVLSTPVILCVLGILLNLYLLFGQEKIAGFGLTTFIRQRVRGESDTLPAAAFRYPVVYFFTLVLGSLFFMNSWDFPIYIVTAAIVLTASQLQNDKPDSSLLWQFIEWAVVLVFIGVVLYWPFYLTFASQAGGFLPSLGLFTRGTHLWIMFLPLFFFLAVFLINQSVKPDARQSIISGIKFSTLLIFGLWSGSYLIGYLLMLAGQVLPGDSRAAGALSMLVNSVHQAPDMLTLLKSSFLDRLSSPGAWITLWLFITMVFSSIFAINHKFTEQKEERLLPQQHRGSADLFILLLALAALGLILVPEFIYLRDFFGNRMNTIFKFYYQAWVMLALISAYCFTLILKSAKPIGVKSAAVLLSVAILLISLFYPFFNLSNLLKGEIVGLDGAANFERYNPGDYLAISWLRETKATGTISEAVGGQYSEYARVATWTGMPTVLGWPGHESQWRGGGKEMGSREADIRKLYESAGWNEASAIAKQYGIDYIYVGGLELTTYQVSEAKFSLNLPLVYDREGVRIYQVTEDALP